MRSGHSGSQRRLVEAALVLSVTTVQDSASSESRDEGEDTDDKACDSTF